MKTITDIETIINGLLDKLRGLEAKHNEEKRSIQAEIASNEAMITSLSDEIGQIKANLTDTSDRLKKAEADFANLTNTFSQETDLLQKYGISMHPTDQIEVAREKFINDAADISRKLNNQFTELDRRLQIAVSENARLTSNLDQLDNNYSALVSTIIDKLNSLTNEIPMIDILASAPLVEQDDHVKELEVNNTSTMVDIEGLVGNNASWPATQEKPNKISANEESVYSPFEAVEPVMPTDVEISDVEKITCPSCSALVPANSTVCEVCGYSFDQNKDITTQSVVEETPTIQYTILDNLGLDPELLSDIKAKITPQKLNDISLVLNENGVSLSDLGKSISRIYEVDPSILSMSFATLKEFGKNNDNGTFNDQADFILTVLPETIKENYRLLIASGREADEISIPELCTLDLEQKMKALGDEYTPTARQNPVLVSKLSYQDFCKALGINPELVSGGVKL